MWHCGSSTPRGHHILRSVCFKSRPRLCDIAEITYRYAIYHVLGDLWIMGSISHFQFAEHLLEGSSSLQFPTSNIDDLRREIATTIMTGSGKHFKSLNPHNGLIPPDALRQRYGSGTSWPRSPQQIGSTLINETISTGRGCGTSQQRPRSGSPCRSAIIP